jgi:hypothetical protein
MENDLSVSRKLEDVNFLVEDWYETLKKYTAKTEFLGLTQVEASSIIRFYQTRYLRHTGKFGEEDARVIRTLEKKIDSFISKHYKGQNFFIRFSMRSPKDGYSYRLSNPREEFQKIFCMLKGNSVLENSNPEYLANLRLRTYHKCLDSLLKCSSAKDVLNLVLSSERVFHDLRLTIECSEKNLKNENLKFKSTMCFRTWNKYLDSEREFRCFVKDNNMTAISQYNNYILIEEFKDQEVVFKIRDQIFNFWKQEIKPILSYLKDYVIDVAVLTNDQLYVVELNPYEKSTGPSLFHWEYDRNILYGSELNKDNDIPECIEIRVRKEYYPNIVDMVDAITEEFFDYKDELTYDKFIDSFYPKKYCTIF